MNLPLFVELPELDEMNFIAGDREQDGGNFALQRAQSGPDS